MIAAESESKSTIIGKFLKKGILVSEDFINSIDDGFDFDSFYDLLMRNVDMDSLVYLNKDYLELINKKVRDINFLEIDRFKTLKERSKSDVYDRFIEVTNGEGGSAAQQMTGQMGAVAEHAPGQEPAAQAEDPYPVNILKSYSIQPENVKLSHFVKHLNLKYKSIEGILRMRSELSGITSIGRVLNKRDRETVSIIGMVSDISVTSKGNYMITLEDPTGEIKAIVSQSKADLIDIAKNMVLDEVIGVVGTNGNKVLFVNNILLPDVPLGRELKKCPDDVYAIFLSDIHYGSTDFLGKDFDKFLRWISGEEGSEKQKQVAEKVKYIFIIGDVVEGVSVYPNQEEELLVDNIYEQYSQCAELIKRIPKDKKIIICPGNHDSGRIAEPQTPLSKEYAGPFYDMPNVSMVSNPALINIHNTSGFPGFDVLMYHGYSFDYYVANVDELRNKGGYDRADLVMRFLLQRRHLAPTHASTLYVPSDDEDPLFISRIPDFFVTGHIHKTSVASYKNITLISGSCWQGMTSFQEKVGHHPEPSRVPIVNLRTREVKILRF
jgi:DNA polymerase II small subunit